MYEKQDMEIYNSKPENKAKHQTEKFLGAFNRKGARLLKAVEQGNHPILDEDPSN